MNMFITFEGGEGSGKTSVIREVEAALIKKGYQVLVTREPGGSHVAEQIRQIILDSKNTSMTAATEALLFAASRTQHLEEKVLPALKEGKIVLCDRYVDSSLAYQAYGRDLGFDFVSKANNFAMKHLPDVTFYLDVLPEIGLKRIRKRDDLNRLDKEEKSFHEKVREGYFKLLSMYPERIVKINANDTIEVSFNEIMKVLDKKL
ncbi:MAG TPA: dTMP kinase [Acholeplasmataceae bacterium]|nr:dTMP kinase [Acholeplasmataceae bacterium]